MYSTREAYGDALVELGAQYDFFVLDADLAKATQTIKFAAAFPNRFLDIGIAEANLMGYAAGISSCGVPVFASTFAAFAAGRAYDQVRNGIAYSNCNVKIGATHGGVLIGADGGSHQCIEDIALMRVIPGMTVICPGDPVQVLPCVKAALLHKGPVYLRFGRLGVESVYASATPFEIGKGHVLEDGTDIAIIATGDMLCRAVEAAKALETAGVSAAVIDMASIKPIDAALIVEYAKKTGYIVTAEDHSVCGGLGGAVSEVLAKSCPTKMDFIGIQDVFGRSGTPSELENYYGISAQHIVETVLKGLGRKA